MLKKSIATFTLLAAFAVCFAPIQLGQVDDFQDGTLMFWSGGDAKQNIANGGPGGTGDRYLRLQSTGTLGVGGKLGMYNETQWAGDWIAAGVTAVSGWFRNLGATDIHLRLVFHDLDGDFTRWTSTTAQVLPAGASWTFMKFSCLEADLTRVLGTETYQQTMSDVDRFMIRHQSGAPMAQAQSIAATLGIDDITATTWNTTVIVDPTDYTVIEGAESSHNLAALLESDDVRLTVGSNTPNSSTTVIEYVTTAPQMTVNRLSFILEHQANDGSRQRNIDLWNYTTNQWETVSTTIGTTTDSTIKIDITTNAGRFINAGNREMKARTRLISAIIPRTWPRVVDLYDRTVWELSD